MEYIGFFIKEYAVGIAFVGFFLLHLLFIKKTEKTRLVVNGASVYLAIFTSAGLSFFEETIAFLEDEWIRAGLFLAFVLSAHVLLSHSTVASFSARITPSHFETIFLYRLAIIGLCLSGLLRFSGLVGAASAGVAHTMFMSFFGFLFWLFLPIMLAFAYRFRTGSGEWLE